MGPGRYHKELHAKDAKDFRPFPKLPEAASYASLYVIPDARSEPPSWPGALEESKKKKERKEKRKKEICKSTRLSYRHKLGGNDAYPSPLTPANYSLSTCLFVQVLTY
jgi:hypothetical protein